jgi:DNA-binding transcriptional LysR family regulator
VFFKGDNPHLFSLSLAALGVQCIFGIAIMNPVHIDAVDLNLLKSLEVLLDERHVSKAAARAHLTQSAMSRTLARLRIVCEDELLVRTPAGYELTPHAQVLRGELATVMPGLRAMFERAPFDPLTATNTIRIAASDYAVDVLGDHLFPLFSSAAPQMSLIVAPMLPSTFNDLDQGRIDVALTPLAAPDHLARHTLFEEDFVCVLASSHPLTAERLTVQDLASFPHATVGGVNPQQTIVVDQLKRLGIDVRNEIRVPYFSAALAAVRETHLIAVVPRRFARRHAGPTLRIAEAPSEIVGITYSMLWHPRLTADRTHAWLRALLTRVASSMVLEAAQ